MSNDPRPALRPLIESLSEEDLTARLAELSTKAYGHPPIIDEDDIEQATEDAADRIISRRRNRS